MEPIEFPEQNFVWKASDPKHIPLPSYVNDRETISRWQLTFRERVAVLLTGRLWLRQCNYGARLQPQLVQVGTPFVTS